MKTGTEQQGSGSFKSKHYTPISEKKRAKLMRGLVGVRSLSEDDAQYLNRLYYNTCSNITLIIFIFVIYYLCVSGFLAALWQPMLADSYWTGVIYCIIFAVTVTVRPPLTAQTDPRHSHHHRTHPCQPPQARGGGPRSPRGGGGHARRGQHDHGQARCLNDDNSPLF